MVWTFYNIAKSVDVTKCESAIWLQTFNNNTVLISIKALMILSSDDVLWNNDIN